MEQKIAITRFNTDKFIMPKRLAFLMKKYAIPVGYKFAYEGDLDMNSEYLYHKQEHETTTIKSNKVYETETEAKKEEERIILLAKGKKFDETKKALKETQENLLEKETQLQGALKKLNK